MYNLLSSVTITCVRGGVKSSGTAARGGAGAQYEYFVHPNRSQLVDKTMVGSVTLAVAGTISGEVLGSDQPGGESVYEGSQSSFMTSQVYSQGRLPAPQLLEILQLGGVLCSHVYHPVQKDCAIQHALDTQSNVGDGSDTSSTAMDVL